MLADDDSLQAEAEALTSCSICTNKYFCNDDEGLLRTPKVLECMHTFCDECLVQHLNSVNSNRLVSGTNFPCPTCRRTIYIPLKGISALPTDLKIKQILTFIENLKLSKKSLGEAENNKRQSSSVQAHKKIDKDVTVGSKSNGNTAINLKLDPKTISINKSNKILLPCKVCQFKGMESPGLHFCLNCRKLFCNKCKMTHHSNNLFSNHRFYNLDDKEKQSTNNELTCSIHKSDFDYFCRDCNEKLCCICVMLPNHGNHRLQSINDTTQSEGSSIKSPYEASSENIYEEIDPNKLNENSRNEQVMSLKQEFDSNISSLEKKVKRVDSIKSSSLKSLEQIEVNLKQAYNEAKKQLDDSYKNFMASISYDKENLDKLNSFKKDLESKLNHSKKLSAEINKNFKSSGQNLQKLLEANTTLIEVMNKAVPSYDYRGNKFNVGVKVELGEMISGNDVFDYDISESPADTSNSNRKKFKTGFFSKRFSNAFSNEGIRKEALLKTLLMRSLNGKIQQPYRPDIDNKDFMYRGEPHWRIEKQFIGRRCCFVEGGKVLVVIDIKEKNVEKKIVFVRSNDGIVLNVTCDVAGEHTVTDILDVCYNPEKKNLYLLCNTNKNALAKKYKINIPSKFINTQDQLPIKCVETSELQSFTTPFCISSRKDTIAIAHSLGEKVSIMNTKFKRLFELTSCDVRKVNYISIDSKERVHLSDSTGNEIKVFQKNGDLDLHFSSTGPRGEVLQPQGIALDDRGNVLVADQSMRCISLYDKDGNFVDKLVESTFNRFPPWGIAFSLERNFLAVTTDEVVELYKL